MLNTSSTACPLQLAQALHQSRWKPHLILNHTWEGLCYTCVTDANEANCEAYNLSPSLILVANKKADMPKAVTAHLSQKLAASTLISHKLSMHHSPCLS